ncbi:hypothetical protein BDAP_000568 [Binucleata daphniae]
MSKMHKDQFIFNFLWVFALLTFIAVFVFNYFYDKEFKINNIEIRKIKDYLKENPINDASEIKIEKNDDTKYKLTNLLIDEINKQNEECEQIYMIIFFSDYYGFSQLHNIIKYIYAKALLKEDINYDLVENKINNLQEIKNLSDKSEDEKCEELKKVYDDLNKNITKLMFEYAEDARELKGVTIEYEDNGDEIKKITYEYEEDDKNVQNNLIKKRKKQKDDINSNKK